MPKSGNFSPAFLGSLTPAATKQAFTSGKETGTSQKHGRFCFRKYMKSWMSILIIIITESTGFLLALNQKGEYPLLVIYREKVAAGELKTAA